MKGRKWFSLEYLQNMSIEICKRCGKEFKHKFGSHICEECYKDIYENQNKKIIIKRKRKK